MVVSKDEQDRQTNQTHPEKERSQINKIRNKRGEVTTDTTEIRRIIRKCYEQLYANKLEKLGKMDKFLETYNLPRMNQEETGNLNRLMTTNEIKSVIKKSSNKQKSWTRWLHR